MNRLGDLSAQPEAQANPTPTQPGGPKQSRGLRVGRIEPNALGSEGSQASPSLADLELGKARKTLTQFFEKLGFYRRIDIGD